MLALAIGFRPEEAVTQCTHLSLPVLTQVCDECEKSCWICICSVLVSYVGDSQAPCVLDKKPTLPFIKLLLLCFTCSLPAHIQGRETFPMSPPPKTIAHPLGHEKGQNAGITNGRENVGSTLQC